MSKISSDGLRRRVMRNFSALVLVRGLGLIAPLITLPYVIRVIGMQNYGHVAFSMVVASFAGSIIQFGFPITGVKAIAQSNRVGEDLRPTFWKIFYASLTIALIISIAHLTIISSVPSLRRMFFVHLGAIFMACGVALFPHWLFLGLEKSFYVAISTLLVRLAHFVMIVLFIRNPSDYILVNFLGAGAAWLNVAIALWMVTFRFGILPSAAKIGEIYYVIRDAFPTFLLQWSPNLYNSASAILLGAYVPPAIFGGFNAANSVITMVGALGGLLSNAFLPVLSTGFERHRTAAISLLAAGIICAASLYFFAPIAAFVLSDHGHEMIAETIQYLSFSLPLLFVYLAYGANYVALTDARVLAGRFTLAISIIVLFMSFILIPEFGVAGFACIMVVARGGMAVMAYTLYWNHRRNRKMEEWRA